MMLTISNAMRFRQGDDSDGHITSSSDPELPDEETSADSDSDESAEDASSDLAPGLKQPAFTDNQIPIPDFSAFKPSAETLAATYDMMTRAGVEDTIDYVDEKSISYQIGAIDSLFLNAMAMSKRLI